MLKHGASYFDSLGYKTSVIPDTIRALVHQSLLGMVEKRQTLSSLRIRENWNPTPVLI